MKVEDILDSFIAKKKFNEEAWQERGLVPSSAATVDLMTVTIQRIAAKVKQAYHEGKSKKLIKRLFIHSIENLQDNGSFDTEEKDFLTDTVCELASLLDIQLEDPSIKYFHPNEAIDHLEQKCDHCGFKLTTWIQAKTEGINYWAWDIVKCNKCGGLNLLSLDPHTLKCVGRGYEFVKQLDKHKYDKDAATQMLNKMQEKTGR